MERFLIRREADIGIAIVGARASARALGFNQNDLDRLATAVSELARNIIKYAPDVGGDILLTHEHRDGRLLLTVEARDNGPGIVHVEAALQEHFSTSGSLGLGLPGVKRMMDEFSIVSIPGRGTVVTIGLVR